MQALFQQKGAALDISILADKPAQDFINAHADILDSSFQQVPMSEAMRRRLTRSDYIFSGIKTFHECNQAFPSLLDENGNRKPFEQFLNEVRKIHKTYNADYLRAEYNFVQASASMAAKWEEFQEDGDRYNLQYRTAGDDRVRPAHAALNRITLPPSDTFWADYYPPNGWNCRCTVVQVRKSKYPATPHDQAMALGEEALADDSKGFFRFNSGQQQKTFPDYNPYTIRRCNDCDIAKGDLKLAKTLVPDNEVCAACKFVRSMQNDWDEVKTERGVVRISKQHGKAEAKINIEIASYFANKYGQEIDLLPIYKGKISCDAFNRTFGYKQEYKVNDKATKSAIDNELRKAAKQAPHVVIRIDSDIDFISLARGIKGRVSQTTIEEVILIRQGKDAVFSREAILANGFKIQPGDFK